MLFFWIIFVLKFLFFGIYNFFYFWYNCFYGGNYVGAIKQMVKYQDDYDSYIFIADLHSITVPQEPNFLKNNIRSLVALYLACGIDANKNTIFIQSENEYHTNISWLLECNTYFGELSRMTQFKDKSSKNVNFSAGLFTYPVLMASDILAYDIDYVPVGIDQKQHVEITRDIAIRFNKKFGDTFKVPDVMISDSGTKIMDLVTPDKKMSKSSENPKGVIRLLDDLNSVRKKIMSATTDSDMKIRFDSVNKPGISNLINIYSALTGKNIKSIEDEFMGFNYGDFNGQIRVMLKEDSQLMDEVVVTGYGDFKKAVADVVCDELSGIQARYNELINSSRLDEILDDGIMKTRVIAKKKYEVMKERMGLGR